MFIFAVFLECQDQPQTNTLI